MAPKTLDLNAHAKTFADTYAHARRTGADRPLAHRFGLADVLGEIEEIIVDRVTKAVAAVTSEHADAIAKLKREHAEELAKLAPRITASTITADRIVGTVRRYDVTYVGRSVVIRDRVLGRVADFGAVTHTYVAQQARRLNTGDLSASALIWDTSTETLRRRLDRRYL
jgi:hypothetical protein